MKVEQSDRQFRIQSFLSPLESLAQWLIRILCFTFLEEALESTFKVITLTLQISIFSSLGHKQPWITSQAESSDKL
jgi:hypothetical protein